MSSTQTHPKTVSAIRDAAVWVFCRVIDHFGDAGVAWRLCTELNRIGGVSVHMYIDHIPTLAALNPNIDPNLSIQSVNGVCVHRWDADLSLPRDSLPACVVEMFACELPPVVRAVIRESRPLWLNWEYLSAEEWAEEMHLLPSPQTDGSEKFFYLMGFSEKSGGLIRGGEADIGDRISGSGQARTLHLYLFGYAAPRWADWLYCWRDLALPMQLSLAGGQIERVWQQEGILPRDALPDTDAVWHTEQLSVRRAPFVAQSTFDAVLRAADVAVVRGEDSFVRAQYAAVPFFWQIYPQDDGAHHRKLHAFWDKVYPYFPPSLAASHRALSDELNGVHILPAAARRRHWQMMLDNLPAWRDALCRWRTYLRAQPCAVEKLISLMAEKRLK